ncbi:MULTISPECIES: LacI family DNA-binding transcriptional regulator [Actibacterium]|uniref:DNA-binding LacI/PurR family transcriptional regulator n=1 Tax=Actibacterium naphthalenivorans TaxID=1614693 RepID=A0A840CIH4_9RHOB|nr:MULTISPECIES: LacI family DNA-binding transcriptional regulator [Actibacterium]ALG90504.1 LacI family transcriptional regulator [Actibacterium sp. EMB200-NS6]MBB4023932.1 DNA-binding LacI/PurR family transcriptional regulator [Actibacterium naphthalenivorans]
MNGQRSVTAEDVARLAGVSRSAVSRAFTNGASISSETRDKVMAAADRLGYRVNYLARSLTLQRTELVALVVSDMDHSFRARIVDLLSRGLVKAGYRPFLLPWSDGDDAGRLIDMMLHYNVSGAIMTSDTPPGEIAAHCARHGVPLVLVNKAPVDAHAPRVLHDVEAAGRLAAEALFEAGCRRVAYAGPRRPSYTIDARRAAFLRHAAELGMRCRFEANGARPNYAGGVEAAAEFLPRAGEVDGVHCGNDFLALGFLDRIRSDGLRVPADLSVVGCDNIAEAAWTSYDLTTVTQDAEAVVSACLAALIELVEGEEEPAPTTVIPVRLVRRGSTSHRA